MTAVHFGAGNIGRGFIGLALHNAGHRVVFVDVAADVIERLVHAVVRAQRHGARLHERQDRIVQTIRREGGHQ